MYELSSGLFKFLWVKDRNLNPTFQAIMKSEFMTISSSLIHGSFSSTMTNELFGWNCVTAYNGVTFLGGSVQIRN